MPAAGQPRRGPTAPAAAALRSPGGIAPGAAAENCPLPGPGTRPPNRPAPLGVPCPVPEGTPLSPRRDTPRPGAQAGHRALETNLPVGQSPQTLCPPPRSLAPPHVSPESASIGVPDETAPGHQRAPGVGTASQPPTAMPGRAPIRPPRAPPALCRSRRGSPPYRRVGVSRERGFRRGERGTARWERHERGGSRRRGDSWADRATLKIAEECEGPTGARSSRRERRGAGGGGGHRRAAGPRHHHRCRHRHRRRK